MTPKQKQLISEIAVHRYKVSKLNIEVNRQNGLIERKIRELYNNHKMINGIYKMGDILVEIESNSNSFKINKVRIENENDN